MHEIIIGNPQVNNDPWRRVTFQAEALVTYIGRILSAKGVTPATHGRVIDLCAGDSSIGKILVENGWNPKDILCIDKKRTETPLVEGLRWEYWDLKELAESLKRDLTLPHEISLRKGKFDLVSCWYGVDQEYDKSLLNEEIRLLCNFFVSPGGFICSDTNSF